MDQDEAQSVLAASSCSGHELQSAISDEADDDCSQSDISLCDDGGSEGEDGEGEDVLGHLFDEEDDLVIMAEDSHERSGLMKSYECAEDVEYSQ